jgi:hypothetical protein
MRQLLLLPSRLTEINDHCATNLEILRQLRCRSSTIPCTSIVHVIQRKAPDSIAKLPFPNPQNYDLTYLPSSN